jgi:hypothetical protein
MYRISGDPDNPAGYRPIRFYPVFGIRPKISGSFSQYRQQKPRENRPRIGRKTGESGVKNG